MKLIFLGHSAFQIITADGTRILIDPFLDQNPASSLKSSQIKADYILLSHAHFDHIGDTAKIADKDTTIICVAELAAILAKEGFKVHSMQVGGAFDFSFGRVKLTYALHGSAMPDGRYAGLAAGVLLSADGQTVYYTGDTGLFGDMKLIAETNSIDVLILPIGGNYTMDVEDAVIAASWIKAGLNIPMHYSKHPPIQADPQDFKQRLAALSLDCLIMAPGDTLDL